MARIIYGAPPSDTPSGGVKVIYRHSELMHKLGVESAVWHPGVEKFKCSWFNSDVNLIKTEELSPNSDLIVLPEIWASNYVQFFKNLGFRVAIYVQNCYFTHVNLNVNNDNAINEAYQSADIILSISQDTSDYLIKILNVPEEKIILQRYSIDYRLFRPRKKSKIITYMPRKMSQHSARVISALNMLIPKDWKIKALDAMSEYEIASHLSESIIFLAFSEFEGLPVPPVEAALSGNIVIGYHGQGGREYWTKPSFVEIEQGDIKLFVSKTIENIDVIESNKLNIEEMNLNIEKIGKYFSKENEFSMLRNFIEKFNYINKGIN